MQEVEERNKERKDGKNQTKKERKKERKEGLNTIEFFSFAHAL